MRPSLRNRVRYIEQRIFDAGDPAVEKLGPVQNMILRTEDPALKWIETATSRIGDWRAAARSVFMRWAITINALHVARDRYRESPDILLRIDTLRSRNGQAERVPMATWRGEQAARNHEAAIPLMTAYAIQDLHGVLEDIILDLYEIFIRAHPNLLMEGPEYKQLRAAMRAKDEGPEQAAAFEALWDERIEKWRRNRTFEGLHKVFGAFWTAAGLKRPSWYQATDVDDWRRVMGTIGEIRHLITHGEDLVSKRLGDLCAAQPDLGMIFKEGEQLDVRLVDLWIVEQFIDSLLNTINLSLMEKAWGPLPRPQAPEGASGDAGPASQNPGGGAG